MAFCNKKANENKDITHYNVYCRKPPPAKTKKDIQREMRDVIRQITASVTFLPLLDGQCKYYNLYFQMSRYIFSFLTLTLFPQELQLNVT